MASIRSRQVRRTLPGLRLGVFLNRLANQVRGSMGNSSDSHEPGNCRVESGVAIDARLRLPINPKLSRP
jgi:hypothetical protein